MATNENGSVLIVAMFLLGYFAHSDSGRFQLIQAHLTTDKINVETLFKIDTESGEVWGYAPGSNVTESKWSKLPRETRRQEIFSRIPDWIKSQLNTSSQMPGGEPPIVGQIVKGDGGSYKFLGGDPRKKESWEKQ